MEPPALAGPEPDAGSESEEEITDIESSSKTAAWLKKTFALVAHHRSGVIAAGTYAGQDQI